MPTEPTHTTTIRISKDQHSGVVEAARRLGVSINKWLADAVETRLRITQRELIDAEFAGMEHDEIYQREAVQITKEFEVSDWEAIR